MLKKIIGFYVVLTIIMLFNACGGSSETETTKASSSNGSSIDCEGVTITDANNCYINYVGLGDEAKECCDIWIAQQQK